MSDVTVNPDPPVLDLPPPANTPEARTPSGEIKDVQTLTADPITTPTSETPPKTPEAPKDAPKVPETYATFTVPDGQTLDPKVIEAAAPLFKKHGLSQEAAQEFVDLYAGQIKTIADGPKATFDTMVSGWRADVLKDASLATGDGLRTDVAESIGRLKATLSSEDRTSFNEVMNMSGLGNHPTIVRALNAWGRALGEGKHVAGNGPSPEGQKPPGAASKPSLAKAMFPNLPG
jgi:hypothetical protein